MFITTTIQNDQLAIPETRRALASPLRKFKTIALVIARVSKYYQESRRLESLPEIHLDTFLILWGLRYKKYGNAGKSSWKNGYQRTALLYQIFITLKWILVSIISFYSGDEHL